jgi:mRNA-degrading endonuclease toxin of MazEF toxin-antitoxin module
VPGAITYKRGSVYLIDFPLPDNSSAIRKYALCLQTGPLLDKRDRFVGALLTTQGLDRKYPWDVFVSASESGTTTGVRILLGEIHIVMKEWVVQHAYDLRPETMRSVDKALLVSLGIFVPP